MATKTLPGVEMMHPFAGTYGNASTVDVEHTVTAATKGDVLRVMRLPAGCRISPEGFVAKVLTAGTADATADFGIAYIDSDDGTDDADYFASAVALDVAGTTRDDVTGASITLSGDAYVTATIGGADIAAKTVFGVRVDYSYVGLK